MYVAINYHRECCFGHTLAVRMAMFAEDQDETGGKLIHKLI